MSASQYKSGENTEMYIRIASSLLQLIYILWVFYVRILYICHNLIDSSIYGGIIPRNYFYYLQGDDHKIFCPRGTKSQFVNPY